MAEAGSIDNLAAVVLAHRDAVQLQNLVAALPGCDVFVHWDAKSPALTPTDRVGSLAESRTRYLPRRDVRLASWSLVALELDALRFALDQSRADYIAVMSGADYPLVSSAQINEALAARRGRSWVRNVPLPYAGWHSPFSQDGGMWRWRWYFPTRHEHVLMIKSRPVFVPMRRRKPDSLMLRASPHWKILSRADAELLLRVLAERPDLMRRARHTFTPEESFISSVMASAELFGERALAVDEHGPYYVSWGGDGGQHPAWFSPTDIDVVRDLREEKLAAGEDSSSWRIFARKFASDRDGEMLAKVRSELWSPTVL